MPHKDFVGDWWSTALPQDQLHLDATGAKTVEGWYKPGSGSLQGQQIKLVGQFDPDPLEQKGPPPDPNHYHQAIGWVVSWDAEGTNEHAVTSWAGQYHHEPYDPEHPKDPQEELVAFFLKAIEREPVPNDEDKSWYRTEVGQTLFLRAKDTSGSATSVPYPMSE
jgi:hypothetical protein